MAELDIFIPAYNCERWLDDLMNSLLAQDHANWRVLIRDDKSSDRTAAKISEWQGVFGEKMVVLSDSGTRNLGRFYNCERLLAATTARWIMGTGADDVWLPNKISRTLAALLEAESRLGETTPLLVCTDAKVVDAKLGVVAESYWQWSRMRVVPQPSLRELIMDCPALGPTFVFNRALLELAWPFPAEGGYIDWWLALVAKAFGHITYLSGPTVLYRRHDTNDSSVPLSSGLLEAVRRIVAAPGLARHRLHDLLDKSTILAAAFLARFGRRLPPDESAALKVVAGLQSAGIIAGRLALLRHSIRYLSYVKTAALYLLL